VTRGLLLVALLLSGCFAPKLVDGEILCSADADCPADFHCSTFDRACTHNGHAEPHWSSASEGVFGGNFTWVVFDSRNHFVVYAATLSAGIFKSTDGGVSWAPASVGLPTRTVNCLAVDPSRDGRLAAATDKGTWLSVDGAATWSLVDGDVMNQSVSRVAFDQAGVLFAVTERQIFRARGAPMYLSAAGGLFVGLFLYGLMLDANGGAYAAATSPSTPIPPEPPPGGAFFLPKDGDSWTVVDSAKTENFLSVGGDGGTLYLGGTSTGLWRGSFTDGTFHNLQSDLPLKAVFAIGTSVGAQTVYAAGNGQPSVIYKSIDAGLHFVPAGDGLPANSGAMQTTIAVEPTDPNIALWPEHSGLYRTTDGQSWSQAQTGLTGWPVTTLLVDPTQPTTVLAGTASGDSSGILWRSDDAGAHWTAVPSGKDFGVNGLAATGDTLLEGGYSGVHYSTDHGQTWNLGLSDFADALAVAPSAPGTAYAAGPTGVQRSTDGGRTWAMALSTYGMNTVAVDPHQANIVYAANQDGVQRSADAGATWAPVNSGLPHLTVHALAVTAAVPARIFAGTENGIYVSSDAGANWTLVGDTNGLRVLSIVTHPKLPARLFAAMANGGVFASVDSGATWQPMQTGLGDTAVNVVAVDPAAPTQLYAGTSGSGIFRTSR
jgi:hypothetical protein